MGVFLKHNLYLRLCSFRPDYPFSVGDWELWTHVAHVVSSSWALVPCLFIVILFVLGLTSFSDFVYIFFRFRLGHAQVQAPLSVESTSMRLRTVLQDVFPESCPGCGQSLSHAWDLGVGCYFDLSQGGRLLWRMVNADNFMLLHRFFDGLHVQLYSSDWCGLDICRSRSHSLAKKILRMMNERGGDYERCFRLCLLEVVVGRVDSRGLDVPLPTVTYQGSDFF